MTDPATGLDLREPAAKPALLRSLADFTREELAALLSEWGQPAYRVGQIWQWVYGRQELDPSAMTDLPAPLREALAARTVPAMLRPVNVALSADGSRKILWECGDGARIETVHMPHRDGRLSLCLSSQVGCALACSFCATGSLGLKRHLTGGEYLEQVLQPHRMFGQRPDNLVLMGMGEPLHNRRHLDAFLARLSDKDGYNFSLSRVTLSTAGMLPELEDFNRAWPQVNLAVSLVSPFDATRSALMPINKRYPVAAIAESIRRLDLGWGARLTLEYPLMAGVNDRPADAREIVRVFGPLKVKVNLIPYNRTSHAGFARPELERIEDFQRRLKAGGIPAFIRWSKGQDVAAACGQLAATTV
ncbi:MAG TPA: 23S rRNA (adenine(2503)-C(2))-methyltransferase RlmN [bacterium]|nr:23S rRNA (adenine(2503)-C(2))-methyltransferase RlmN [bacterium]